MVCDAVHVRKADPLVRTLMKQFVICVSEQNPAGFGACYKWLMKSQLLEEIIRSKLFLDYVSMCFLS